VMTGVKVTRPPAVANADRMVMELPSVSGSVVKAVNNYFVCPGI